MRAFWLAIILVLLTPIVLAQSTATPPQVQNLYMAGGSYGFGGTPPIAGSALYAHAINTSGTYAFTMIDALPGTIKPFTVYTNVGIGIAQKIATIDGVQIFVPTAAGISYTGPNAGWAWTTGVGAPFQVKKTNWYIMPTVRVLKSSVSGGTGYQPILGILFGWGQ